MPLVFSWGPEVLTKIITTTTSISAAPPSTSNTNLSTLAAASPSQPISLSPANLPEQSSPPVPASASLSNNGTNLAKVIGISIAVSLSIILVFSLAYCCYHRHRRNLRLQRIDAPYTDDTMRRISLVPESNASGNHNFIGGKINSRRQSLHPDIVAPIYSIRTMPPESHLTDAHLITADYESESTVLPPSSSRVPIPSTLAGKHEIETRQSTLAADAKPDFQPAIVNGTQEDAEMLQRQLEMMKEQMEIMQGRISVLTRGSVHTGS